MADPLDRLDCLDRLDRIDRAAAARATLLSAVVVVAFVAAQGAVVAAVTGGEQPMPAVERVPMSPDAAAWGDAPSRTVSLSKQRMAPPYGGGSVDELRVETVTNDTHVAFRLTWTDPTRDASLRSPRSYSDAAAVMLHSGSTPPITMGATGTPVDIWYWRASWQFGERGAEWSGDMYAYPHGDERTRPGLAAGNPLSKRTYDRYAQNYYAKGFGSLSVAPAQNVRGHAERTDDGWRVVFVRERSTNGTYDAGFDETGPMYLAFAVWNGSADEANGQKSITLQFTRLDPSSGNLSAARTGTGASDTGGDGAAAGTGDTTPSGSSGPDGPWIVRTAGNAVTALVVVVVLTWLVAYRRMAA